LSVDIFQRDSRSIRSETRFRYRSKKRYRWWWIYLRTQDPVSG